MSLVAFALRIAAVRAIRAAIWPEFRVLDSPQQPLALIEDGHPVIALYTGHDTGKRAGTDLYGGNARVSLMLHVFLPAECRVTSAGQTLTFDTRSEGSETLLDVVARRITGALLDAGATPDPWSALWLRFVVTAPRSQNNSYLYETERVRTSMREIVLDLETLDEPIPGAPPAGVWADLVALMRTDAGANGVAPLADWLAAEIAGPAALTQAERDRIDLGLSRYAAQRVRIAPFADGMAENVADDPGDALAIDEVPADPDAAQPDGSAL